MVLPLTILRSVSRSRPTSGWVAVLLMILGLLGAPTRIAAQIDPAKDAVPASPEKAWAAQTSATTLQLNWEHMAGIATYRIFCAVGIRAAALAGSISSPGVTNVLDAITGMARRLAYTIAIRVNEPHRCYVQPVDPKGLVSKAIALNEVVPVSKDLVAAGAPSSVVATQSAPGQITLTWNPVAGATAYAIGRSVYPSGFTTLCSLCPNVPTYVDRYVKPDVKHTYTVTAITPAGPSTRMTSNVVTPSSGEKDLAATTDTTATTISGAKGLSDVKAAVTPDGAVRISWASAIAGGTVQVFRMIGDQLFENIRTITNLMPGVGTFVDNVGSNLGGPLAVSYRVRLTYPEGAKALVEELTSNQVIVGPKGLVTTPTVTPTPPRDAFATATSGTSVTLTWIPAVGVSQCRITRSLNSAAYTTLTTLPATSSRFVDVAANLMMQRPRYKITCGDPKGLAMNAVNFTTPVWSPKAGS